MAKFNKIAVLNHKGREYVEKTEFKKAVSDQTWKMAQIALLFNVIGAFVVWLVTENTAAAVIPVLCSLTLFAVIHCLNNLPPQKTDMA